MDLLAVVVLKYMCGNEKFKMGYLLLKNIRFDYVYLSFSSLSPRLFSTLLLCFQHLLFKKLVTETQLLLNFHLFTTLKNRFFMLFNEYLSEIGMNADKGLYFSTSS